MEKSSISTDTVDTEESENISRAERSLLQKVKRLVLTAADLEVQRKDPNSPLHHVKSFEELHLSRDILRGLYDMGYNAPSKFQVCR